MLTNLLILTMLIIILYQCYMQTGREGMNNRNDIHDDLVAIKNKFNTRKHITKNKAKADVDSLHKRLSKLEKKASQLLNSKQKE